MKARSCCSPRHLNWSQDQDLEHWGRRIWRGRRRPLGTPPADCIGLYCSRRPSQRIFPYEVSILHDFCPMVVPWAFTDDDRDGFVKFLTENILASDVVLSDSHSTKADAAWFSPLDPERIVVAHAGAEPLRGDPSPSRAGRAVGPDRPGGLDDRAAEERRLPVRLVPEDDAAAARHGAVVGGEARLDDLARGARADGESRPGGAGSGSWGTCSDARLCRLYQKAGWSIYPSRYEGFGFPILDSLRHGTPVLSSCTSSMGEFDHPGVFFFDPQDPATVDLAWQRLQAAKPVTIPQARLDDLYNWDLVARALLDAHARNGEGVAAGRPRSLRPGFSGAGAGQAEGGPLPPAVPGPEQAASRRVKQKRWAADRDRTVRDPDR